MYRKAKLFGADKIALQIIRAQTPDECKMLGRSRQIPFDKIWGIGIDCIDTISVKALDVIGEEVGDFIVKIDNIKIQEKNVTN